MIGDRAWSPPSSARVLLRVVGLQADVRPAVQQPVRHRRSAVTAKLAEAKEPYQLADGGQTILVPQEDVYQQRITLSGEGLPSGNGGGAATRCSTSRASPPPSSSSRSTYQRALEGELRKTIEAIDGVQTAVVHLAMPQEDVFTDERRRAHAPPCSCRPARASAARRRRRSQAIVHLVVVVGVQGLTADQVTVADSSGQVLHSGGEGGASAHERRPGAAGQSIRGRHHAAACRACWTRSSAPATPWCAVDRRPRLRPDQGRPRGVHRGPSRPRR